MALPTAIGGFARHSLSAIFIQLLLESADDRLQCLDARVELVVRLDDRPRRKVGAGLEEHVFRGALVIFPLAPVAPVLLGDLPLLVVCVLTFLEAAQLLLLADVHPELEDDRAGFQQLALELIDLAVGALPRSLGTIPLDALDQHAPIPRAVKDGDLPLLRQP